MAGGSVIGWVFAAATLLLVAVAWAAGAGLLRRNHILGIRIPPLFASDATWRAGHAAALPPAAITAAAVIVCDVIGIFVPVVYWVAVACFVLGVVAVFLVATRAAKAVTV